MKNKNLPSGTRDEFGTEAEVKETIQNKLFKTFRQRGFRKLTTPVLEYSDVFQPLSAENYRPYQLLDEQGGTVGVTAGSDLAGCPGHEHHRN